MKKTTIAFIWLLGALCIRAEPIDVETARHQAADFFNQHSTYQGKRKAISTQQMRLLYVHQQKPDGAPLLYVFGQEDCEGYAVIAGDDVAVSAVLGYSKTRTFDPLNIPCCLQYYIEEYGRQLEFARKNPSSIPLNASKEEKASIAPLCTSKWGQEEPFNNLCPIDPQTGKRSVVGCVATAMAQIMYYHKWPNKGEGSMSYTWQEHVLSADFGSTNYQWDKMKDEYNPYQYPIQYTSEEANAVATLMYHCGVAVNMSYSSHTSYSDLYYFAPGALFDFFQYSNSINSFLGDSDEMEKIIYSELSSRRPVLISGGSHAFICDGYENGYFHFNFGWGGLFDDYFLLSSINPAFYNFSSDQCIVFNIKKQEEIVDVDGIQYEISSDGSASVIKGNVVGKLDLPSHIQWNGRQYEVSAILEKAFYQCTGLTSVTIPNSVTSIGYDAFSNCSNLTSLVIPNSVTYIGSGAFRFCGSLRNVYCYARKIPTSESSVFEGDKNVYITLHVPQSTIGDYKSSSPWNGFGSIIALPKYKLTYMADRQLYKETDVEEGETIIVEPEPTKEGFTFSGWSDIPETMPSHDVTINGTFTKGIIKYDLSINGVNYKLNKENKSCIVVSGEADLSGDIIIPNHITCGNIDYRITNILDSAFFDCTNITSISIPNSVTNMAKCSFNNCRSLKSMIIEDGDEVLNIYSDEGEYLPFIDTSIEILYIGRSISYGEEYFPFQGIGSLRDVKIGSKVKTLGNSPFFYCLGMTTIVVDSLNPIYDSRDNCNAIIETSTNTLKAGCENTFIPNSVSSIGQLAFAGRESMASITIPNSVTSIGYASFANCLSLQSIELPNSMIHVDKYAFYGCTNLKSVVIPESMTYIEEGVFAECSSLTSIDIPNSVTSIGYGAILGCSNLKTINIGKNVQSISSGAFQKCKSLTDIFCYPKNRPATLTNIFLESSISSANLHVPSSLLNDYKSTSPWNGFGSIIALPKYKLIYVVDGQEYKVIEVEYGESITPEAAPTKEGYTFSGWSEIPETMLAKDVTITGSFTFVDAIEDVVADDGSYEFYTLDGKQVKSLQKGVNIIRYENGQIKKVFIK